MGLHLHSPQRTPPPTASMRQRMRCESPAPSKHPPMSKPKPLAIRCQSPAAPWSPIQCLFGLPEEPWSASVSSSHLLTPPRPRAHTPHGTTTRCEGTGSKDDVAGERRRKGDAFPPPSSASFPALTPRGPGLLLLSSSPSGSSFLPSPPPAADAIVLALPASNACAAASLAASTLLVGAMDGGSGEALLAWRSKAKKRPAPAAPHAQGREFGGGDRLLALWRDYHDLLQETEAKKRRLESANRRKLRLLAEVKFLRRKYKFLVKCNSQQPNYKLQGQDWQIQSPMGVNEASAFADHGVGTGVPSTRKNTNLDLNQDSVMIDEGFDRRGQGHPKPGNFDQDGVDVTTDVKFSVCSRDTGNSPSSDDKRTISWQDRLALQA